MLENGKCHFFENDSYAGQSVLRNRARERSPWPALPQYVHSPFWLTLTERRLFLWYLLLVALTMSDVASVVCVCLVSGKLIVFRLPWPPRIEAHLQGSCPASCGLGGPAVCLDQLHHG